MHGCPGCARPIPTSMFLCMVCADATPDVLIVTIGAAIDDGDDAGAAAGIDEAVSLLSGG